MSHFESHVLEAGVTYLEYLYFSSIVMMNCWKHEVLTRNVQSLDV